MMFRPERAPHWQGTEAAADATEMSAETWILHLRTAGQPCQRTPGRGGGRERLKEDCGVGNVKVAIKN